MDAYYKSGERAKLQRRPLQRSRSREYYVDITLECELEMYFEESYRFFSNVHYVSMFLLDC